MFTHIGTEILDFTSAAHSQFVDLSGKEIPCRFPSADLHTVLQEIWDAYTRQRDRGGLGSGPEK